MWNASAENRNFILAGSLKKLFLEGVHETLGLFFTEKMDFQDLQDEDQDITTNGSAYNKPYNRLSNAEKVYAIAKVTRDLTGPGRPPELLQWNESAVYAVFQSIQVAIECEIEDQKLGQVISHYWRELVAKTERDTKEYDDDSYMDPLSKDVEEWEIAVESLADEILWDRDFLDEDIFMDQDPERADKIKNFAGIDRKYFSKPIPIVTKKKFELAARFLRKTIK